ncbi:MAG TPA: aldo/keto reductase [Myxococcota bacterium]|jgi:aryl-alcohol dehydrogenase-like predicted oxidoreductase
MSTPNASASGTFALGGDLIIHRLGFGAMRVTGAGVFGPPTDRAECLRTLRRLPELGVDFIDTAESYGPHVSEELIKEALHPYQNIVIATKGGLERPGPSSWEMNGRPAFLQKNLDGSLKRLGVDRIDLWQLHRIDSKVPRAEQLGAIAEFQKSGKVRHLGLSEVSVDDIVEAQRYFQVVSVQNRYSPSARGHDPVLDYCEKHSIGFIPWAPLGGGALAKSGSALDKLAAKHKASPSQIALAWLLARSPVMLPIPGTSSVAHLEENVGAASIKLSDDEVTSLAG